MPQTNASRCAVWMGSILLLDVVLRALTSIPCEQEGSLCIFLCVCCVTSNLNSRMLQSDCEGISAHVRMMFIASSVDVWSEMLAKVHLSWKYKGHVKTLFMNLQM